MSDTARFIAITHATAHGHTAYLAIDINRTVVVLGKTRKPRVLRRSKVALQAAAQSVADSIATDHNVLLIDVLPADNLQRIVAQRATTRGVLNHYKETDSGLYE